MKCWKRVKGKSVMALATAVAAGAVIVPNLALATQIPANALLGDDFNETEAGPGGINTDPMAVGTARQRWIWTNARLVDFEFDAHVD